MEGKLVRICLEREKNNDFLIKKCKLIFLIDNLRKRNEVNGNKK